MDTLLSGCPRHSSSAFVPDGNNRGAPYQPARGIRPEIRVNGLPRLCGMKAVPG